MPTAAKLGFPVSSRRTPGVPLHQNALFPSINGGSSARTAVYFAVGIRFEVLCGGRTRPARLRTCVVDKLLGAPAKDAAAIFSGDGNHRLAGRELFFSYQKNTSSVHKGKTDILRA